VSEKSSQVAFDLYYPLSLCSSLLLAGHFLLTFPTVISVGM
jgi:hypothetical protein